MMSRNPARFWTFNTLIGAFLDLFVAYFLLCGSTIAFFAAKFLGPLGFRIPNFDLSDLLFDYPTDRISSVEYSVARKFPFDSIFYKTHNSQLNLNLDRGELEFGEASCSSKSDEKQRGFDVKGKGGVNYRVKGSIRRRRKASLDTGKYSSSVSSSPNWITCVEEQSNHKEEHESSLNLGDAANTSNYEAEVVKSLSDESGNNNRNRPKEMVSMDEGDKDKKIISLTEELEEERAARAALYVELDQERNASATAADEAMAMILRLQEEKASVEMELRQYQRMIEEKSAYDEEEMNILKEILLRREREKHFLEKQVEAYRQMVGLENDPLSGENIQDFVEDPDMILHQLSMSIAEKRGYEDTESLKLPQKNLEISGEEQSFESDKLNEDSKKNTKQQPLLEDSDGGFPKEGELNRGGSEAAFGRLPPMNSKNSRRNSTSVLDNERIRIDNEVEWLRERLRIVQEGREKLNFSIDNREKESLQLQLLEDITRQLQEIRMLTEPRTVRQGSLPLPTSKELTKKRRGRSVSAKSS